VLGRTVYRRLRKSSGANQDGAVLSPAQRDDSPLVFRNAKGRTL
jgi:hypothetical protein